VSIVEPFYADTEITTHPFILPEHVDDMDTYKKRPDDAAVAASRAKAIEGKQQAELDWTAAEGLRIARKGKAKAVKEKGKAPATDETDFIVDDSENERADDDYEEAVQRSRLPTTVGQSSGSRAIADLLEELDDGVSYLCAVNYKLITSVFKITAEKSSGQDDELKLGESRIESARLTRTSVDLELLFSDAAIRYCL
jgi:hypothetical protein